MVERAAVAYSDPEALDGILILLLMLLPLFIILTILVVILTIIAAILILIMIQAAKYIWGLGYHWYSELRK